MSLNTTETLQRLFSQLTRDLVADLPDEQRADVQAQLEQRADDLLRSASSNASPTAFADLIGLGARGALPFDAVSTARIEPDFDESVTPTQLHAAAELYYIYQHERMKVFQVVSVLMQLFHQGRMRIQRGPGARALYLVERQHPLRYKPSDRQLAYYRAFHFGRPPHTSGIMSDAVTFRGFQHHFVALKASIAQYHRDMIIGEVIRGSQHINQRPFASQATIQRIGEDLRWQLDRATYGNIVALTVETSNYLKTILEMLDTPDIKKAFDANTKWDVIEAVSQRHLGGAFEISQRSKMADAGRRLLQFVADNRFKTRDYHLFQAEIQPLGPLAEEWIAAFRMTRSGRNFRGVGPTLQSMIGLQPAPNAA